MQCGSQRDFVLIEGTNYQGATTAFEFDVNADIARNLSAPVLLVVMVTLVIFSVMSLVTFMVAVVVAVDAAVLCVVLIYDTTLNFH